MKLTRVLLGLWMVLVGSSGCRGQSSGQSEDDLKDQVGQMLMIGFRGTDLQPDDPFLTQIRELNLGGVILFDYDVPSKSPVRNILSADQVRTLIEQLQAAARIPLLVAVDQEGGRIARLKEARGFPKTVSQKKLGDENSETVTRKNARVIAGTLKDLGFNFNLAPVLDLDVYPENPIIGGLERSYGSDPRLVSQHARWTIEEFHRAGILAGLKHFPGHGSSRADSHLGLPDVSDYWSEAELIPFREMVESGLADAVMTAHLFNSHWDPSYPATLSPAVIDGLLRRQIGFDGVVVSDDMQMGAIVQQYSFEKSIELAIAAGVDILAIGNNQQYDPEVAPRAVAVIRRLLEEKQISEERIRKSLTRIQALKERLGNLQ